MKRFFARVARAVWSRRALKITLWLVTWVVLFYVEEDWRGESTWAATKKKWERRGETFDWNRFTPPFIPDDQNLAAIPLFQLERRKPGDSYLQPLRLQRAMRRDLPGGGLPSLASDRPDDLPDMDKVRQEIARNYADAFPGGTRPESSLRQFEGLYPFLHDFLAAAAARPFFRLPLDYTTMPPAARPLGPMAEGIRLSKILTVQAIIALDEHQPELALADIKANGILVSGWKRRPTLVAGLVAVGMTAISQPALHDGFTRHAWSDGQLQEIDRMLRPINLLEDYQFGMRCEAAESVANMEWYNSRVLRGSMSWGDLVDDRVPWTARIPTLWPRGWWEYNNSKIADLLFEEAATVDPRTRRVFPQMARALDERAEHAATRWDANAPWSMWFTLASPPLTKIAERYAITQARIDEARLAAALERYWLVHQAYPASLDALTPAFTDRLPHDMMNGQPYRYQLSDDGGYRLYSVGWDMKDQGGEVVRDRDKKVIDEQGDWPWVIPPPAAGNR